MADHTAKIKDVLGSWAKHLSLKHFFFCLRTRYGIILSMYDFQVDWLIRLYVDCLCDHWIYLAQRTCPITRTLYFQVISLKSFLSTWYLSAWRFVDLSILGRIGQTFYLAISIEASKSSLQAQHTDMHIWFLYRKQILMTTELTWVLDKSTTICTKMLH